ncbi:MAG: hypothetical protein KGI29_03300 [Pseudomonadota bacterium]|nr:hypothetical protein [Pseudomonadota bacterium]MDE3037146.1 hypothetical protein [Pseudomonadota bacterium]
MSENLPESSNTSSFTRIMYGALGGAAFCGLLGMVGQGLSNVIAGGAVAASFGPLSLLAMGAMIVAGVAFIYMSMDRKDNSAERQSETRQQNISSPQHEREHALAMEHMREGRADGRQWTDATQPSGLAQRQAHL